MLIKFLSRGEINYASSHYTEITFIILFMTPLTVLWSTREYIQTLYKKNEIDI